MSLAEQCAVACVDELQSVGAIPDTDGYREESIHLLVPIIRKHLDMQPVRGAP